MNHFAKAKCKVCSGHELSCVGIDYLDIRDVARAVQDVPDQKAIVLEGPIGMGHED